MEKRIPRIVLAGSNSGCGKTTVSCAILQALLNQKKNVGAFKCGPDYIDPMFHREVIGAPSTNLDPYFFSENTLRWLLAKNGAAREINIIEGVMGYYDGLSPASTRASTYEVARWSQSPVVLVLGARGASLSLLATLQGFLQFCPEPLIRGVILNQCSSGIYAALAKEIEARFDGRIRPLGFLPKLPNCRLESRHLGLVTAAEVKDLKKKLQRLARQAAESIDLDGLTTLAKSVPPLSYQPVELPRFAEPVRIAVARDKAFCFYYEDSLSALTEMGAELVPFSPLAEAAPPAEIHGLYLGGGYPELYARQLSENRSMQQALKKLLSADLPCIAECGGFMYLGQSIGEYPMLSFLPGKSFDTGKLTRFGYVRLRAKADNMLCRAGEEIAGHEFHHWDSSCCGDGFRAEKASGKSWDCIFAGPRLYAGYPHFHFYANPAFAIKFYETCLKEKKRHDETY